MTDRRSFLKAGSGSLMRSPCCETLQQARALVRNGKLGRVEFCRIAHKDLLPAVQYVLGPAAVNCVIGVEAEAEGAAILGSHATLALSGTVCRLFARD